MGCDGGTIPRRDELVKLKKKAEKVWKVIGIYSFKFNNDRQDEAFLIL